LDKIFFDQITRPTLILNEQRARENIRHMAQKANQAGVQFRPHFKTHQSLEIATWFHDEGVSQITVSSVDMAEYFASGGWNEITIAFPLNFRQINQIQSLSKRVNLGVLIENLDALRLLGKVIRHKINIWLKIDSGSHRTGIPWNEPDVVLQILAESRKYPQLVIRGILTHAGNTYSAQSPGEAIRLHSESTTRMIDLQKTIIQAGFTKPLISIGDTPGCSLLNDFGLVDEIRPGNFVFYDSEQLEIGSCIQEQISVALACPIVARHPERNEIVIYGGAVHLSKESFLHAGHPSYGLVALPEINGWGEILPDCSVVRVSQEHGILSIPDSLIDQFPLGGIVMVIPVHSCLTAQLMRRYLTLGGQAIEMMPV
jgi:D-serine deaminase-like pyridoxal phosphate-dependent protein